ncbi:MAG: 16S rRNA (cytosine(1402)-N(4))-methyltransferase RsmH [Smithella sp.]|nr:16S rRNA (cytosine(1402)-N(4))-methyltransferase RsmH [Smithella sp.]
MDAVFSHEPVMLEEVLFWLAEGESGVYVDATIGGAGHARAILDQTGGRLIGIDCDADAVAAAEDRLSAFGARKVVVRANFADLGGVLRDLGVDKVDGVLMDLGVSSHQLDTAARGFSFNKPAPLDMRMDQSRKLSARDVVNNYGAAQLEKIIRLYGEEKMAARIATAIVQHRQAAPVETTAQLAGIVTDAMPLRMRHLKIHPATRTFQALRIAVNGELDCIRPGMEAAADALRPGGRVAVISFHSLEDRIVKNTFSEMAAGCVCPKDIPYCVCDKTATVKVLTRKAVTPSAEEIKRNPRARSAKLRVAERI